ncbi:MAG TPA: hypothetical protein PLZ08_10035 [Bacillota bacterium]|jgi:hypothetical protein|nr:hypothetical protein [Bacillota bacterium]HOL10574.1 hypothetical protein [Bacillota bacterium]HPO98276.1 hypothetical protein [Bacillota bacterium]
MKSIDFSKNLEIYFQTKNPFLILYLKKKHEDPCDSSTTENTLLDLEYDSEDVRRELSQLEISDYIENIVDDKDSKLPPFWVFGKVINAKEIYIKLKIKSPKKIFCVSFHYAKYKLKNSPYK